MSHKGKTYMYLKEGWAMEYYLTSLDKELAHHMVRFRTANHKFPIEVGRYNGLDVVNRKCRHCTNAVGDEIHYLLECPKYKNERKRYIDRQHSTRPNIFKFKEALCSRNTQKLHNLATFMKILLRKVE